MSPAPGMCLLYSTFRDPFYMRSDRCAARGCLERSGWRDVQYPLAEESALMLCSAAGFECCSAKQKCCGCGQQQQQQQCAAACVLQQRGPSSHEPGGADCNLAHLPRSPEFTQKEHRGPRGISQSITPRWGRLVQASGATGAGIYYKGKATRRDKG